MADSSMSGPVLPVLPAPSGARRLPLQICDFVYHSTILRLWEAYRGGGPLPASYVENVLLPRLLPWAIPTALLGLVILLAHFVWRGVFACCPLTCTKQRRGSLSEAELFSRKWFRGLSAAAAVLCLAVLASSTVGLVYTAVADRSLYPAVHKVQDFVVNLRVEAVGVLEEGQTVTGAALTVHDYVETNLQIESLQRNLTCATQAFTNDSDPLGDVIITITTDTLPTVFNVLSDLTYVKNQYLPALLNATGTLEGASSWKDALGDDARAAAVALNSLASSDQGSAAAIGALDDAIGALEQLDIMEQVVEVDRILRAMDDLDALREVHVLDSLSGNITILIGHLTALQGMLREGREEQRLNDAVACTSNLVEMVININNTLVILSPENQSNLKKAQSAIAAYYAVLGPEGSLTVSVANLGRIISTLNTVLGGVTTALNLIFIPSGGAARSYYQQIQATLIAAEAPVNQAASNMDLYRANGGGSAAEWGELMSVVRAAEASLQDLASATLNPGFIQQAQITAYLGYMRLLSAPASALQRTLSGSVGDTLEEYHGYLEAIEAQLGGLDTARMQELLIEIETVIDNAVGALEDAESKLDELQTLLLRVDSGIEEFLAALPDESRISQASLRVESILVTAYSAQLAVSITVFAAILLLSLGLLVSQFVLIQGVAMGLTVAGALLMMLTFLVYIPYGGGAQFTSDLCYNMELWMYWMTEQIVTDSLVRAKVDAALDFFLYGDNFDTIEQMLLAAFGLAADSIQQLLAEVEESVRNEIDEYGLVLNPALMAEMRPLVTTFQTLLRSVYSALSLVSFQNVHALYVSVKSAVCCEFVPNLANIWRVMFAVGILLSILVLLMMCYLSALDVLKPFVRGCACAPVRYPWLRSRWAEATDTTPCEEVPAAPAVAVPAEQAALGGSEKPALGGAEALVLQEVELSMGVVGDTAEKQKG